MYVITLPLFGRGVGGEASVVLLCHSDEVCHTGDNLFHLLLVLYVGFLPLGVFKFIANALLVRVGDGLADKVVLTLEFVLSGHYEKQDTKKVPQIVDFTALS